MKRVIYASLLLTAFLFISCNKEATLNAVIETKATQKKDVGEFFVSKEKAMSFIAEVFSDTKIKSVNAISKNGTPLMYIINFDEGWKIVSADKRMPPVLAFSESGQFNDSWEDNPGTRLWINATKSAISTVITNNEIANKNTEIWDSKSSASVKNAKDLLAQIGPNEMWTKIKLSETTTESQTMLYGPYTETTWGQDSPWNNNFPIDYYAQTYLNVSKKYVTGCVSVALSQLFYYYHFKYGQPSGLYTSLEVTTQTPTDTIGIIPHYIDTVYVRGKRITLNRSNYENPSLRWSLMAKSKTSGGNSSYVSDLMLDVGSHANTVYSGIFGSSATPQDAYNTLQYYGLQASMGGFQKDTVVNNLIQGRPIFIGGYDYNGSGHAWVLDGYYKSTITKKTNYKWMLGYNPQEGIGEPASYEEALAAAELMGMDKPEDPMVTEETKVTTYDYYNMNLGWNGKENGFYLMVDPGLEVYLPYNQYPVNVTIFYNIIPSQ